MNAELNNQNAVSEIKKDLAVLQVEVVHIRAALVRITEAVEKLAAVDEKLKKLDDQEVRLRKLEHNTTVQFTRLTAFWAVIASVSPFIAKKLGL